MVVSVGANIINNSTVYFIGGFFIQILQADSVIMAAQQKRTAITKRV